MTNSRKEVFLITLAAVLVALGDLRNLITPLGYWLAWLTWLGIALIYILFARSEESKKINIEVKILLLGFSLMLLGFFVATIANQDLQTVYQGFKLLVIMIIGLCIFKLTQKLPGISIINISAFVIIISFIVFLTAKFLITPLHIYLGDGRQGSIVAMPGVLWKAGCFFSAFALAHFLSSKKPALGSAVIFILGVFLVIVDGSRTGILWLLISTFVLVAARLLNIRQSYTATGIILLATGSFLFVYLAALVLSGDLVSASILAFERLADGDSARSDMIYSGFRYADACLPFGCGFGSTVSDNYGMVVHNAYLGALGDLGIIGLVGFVLVTFSAFIAIIAKNLRMRDIKVDPNNYVALAAILGSAGFIFIQNLHPFQTEMSEWGLFFLMFSFVFARATNSYESNPRHSLRANLLKA